MCVQQHILQKFGQQDLSFVGQYWNHYPGTLSSLPSHCNSFEDQGAMQFKYVFLPVWGIQLWR